MYPPVDITVYHDSFHGDLNETMFVGVVSEQSRRLVSTAYECMMKAIRTGWSPEKGLKTSLSLPSLPSVRPGVRYRDIGAVIQQHAQSNGCSVVRTYCGHGINRCFCPYPVQQPLHSPSLNRLFHTAPNVPHYASEQPILLHSHFM